MLDTYENRLGFSAAFGITAYECFAVTFQSYGMVLSPETAHLIKSHVPSYLSSKTSGHSKLCNAKLLSVRVRIRG